MRNAAACELVHDHRLPSCATSYHVSQAAIGAGRAVICPRCAAQWFVTGSDVHAAAPTLEADGGSAARPAETQRLSMPQRRRSAPASRRIWPTLALALPLAAFALHAPLARHVPAAGALFAKLGLAPVPPGLALRGIAGTRDVDAATTTLAVRGEIANPHRTDAGVPDLALSVSDAAGREVYRWRAPPPVRKLAAGATATFKIEVPRVPAAGQSIAVRFAAADTH